MLVDVQQRLHTPGRPGVPYIKDTEEWGKIRYYDPVVDRGKRMPVEVSDDIVTRLESYPGSSDDTPDKKMWVEKHKITITTQMKIK